MTVEDKTIQDISKSSRKVNLNLTSLIQKERKNAILQRLSKSNFATLSAASNQLIFKNDKSESR